MMNIQVPRLDPGTEVTNSCPLPKAGSSVLTAQTQLWCEFNSWGICPDCQRVQPRDLTAQGFQGLWRPNRLFKKCIFCAATKAVPSVVHPPAELRQLPPELIAALCPLQVNYGSWLQAKDRFGRGNGYRLHGGMINFAWQPMSVEQQLQQLKPELQPLARTALQELLRISGPRRENSAYGEFYSEHHAFLTKHTAPTERERKRWLRFLEREGLECALWPHLFLQRQQCMTWARLQSTTRQARGQHRSTLEERKDALWRQGPEEEDDPADVAGVRRTYMSHVLSEILDFGASYEILHFTYDLALWTDIGSKRNLGYGVPLRLLMKGHSFSNEYWQSMHRALVDLVRQKGYPPVFSTHSPLEWSWPNHHLIIDGMAKTQRGAELKRFRSWYTAHTQKHVSKKKRICSYILVPHLPVPANVKVLLWFTAVRSYGVPHPGSFASSTSSFAIGQELCFGPQPRASAAEPTT